MAAILKHRSPNRIIKIKKWRLFSLPVILFSILLSIFPVRGGTGLKCEEAMTQHDPDFVNVPFKTGEQNPCSPDKPHDFSWRGIVIRAKKQIFYKKEDGGPPSKYLTAIMPVCGFLSVELAAVSHNDALALVAVNQETGAIFRGNVGEDDPGMMAEDPHDDPFDPGLLEGQSSEEFFNENLTDYLKLPLSPATYQVYGELGPYRSNTVTISVDEKK